MGKVLDKTEVMRAAEGLMFQRMRRTEVQREICQRFGCGPRTARKYMRLVTDNWGEEAKAEDRTERRNSMRETANDLYTKAMERRIFATAAGGGVQCDEEGEPVILEAPDLRAAARALEILAKLDGLFDNTIKIDATGTLSDLVALAFPSMPTGPVIDVAGGELEAGSEDDGE